MREIKEVIVYSNGDSNDLATWSNVPYFFCRELEERGIKVDRVNIHVNKDISMSLFFRLFSKIKKKLIELSKGAGTMYRYNKSSYYYKQVVKKMKEGRKSYPEADAEIAFDLMNNNKSDIPFVMIGDWTIEYRLRNKYHRNPDKYEQSLINRQFSNLSNADMAVSIFPGCYENMREHLNNASYFGHVVNSMNKYSFNGKKNESERVLFIGKDKYKEGLNSFIEIVKKYNCEYGRNIRISVIGMNDNDIDGQGICDFYGYLNKTDEKQRDLYYRLISETKVMANVTKDWNGVSSLFEALYHGTPILVSANVELEKLIGETEYCHFCDNEDIFYDNFVSLMEDDNYLKISQAAHDFANQYTWDKFMDKFLAKLKSL